MRNQSYFVAVDIGCIECREPSAVLGLFRDEKAAKLACSIAEEEHERDGHGQHYCEVFKAEVVDRSPAVNIKRDGKSVTIYVGPWACRYSWSRVGAFGNGSRWSSGWHRWRDDINE